MPGLPTYFLPDGYRCNLAPAACNRDADKETDSQWHVYQLAQSIAQGAVLDIGCGNGSMLMEAFPDRRTLGLDTPHNIQVCRTLFPSREWETIDLDSPVTLPTRFPAVIMADVIEHLLNPEHVLREVARLVGEGGATALISTPERNRKRGLNHLGPPPNTCHVREWTVKELQDLLHAFGLKPRFQFLPTNKRSAMLHTVVAVCRPPSA
jgi:SAM-dependent methyltransferase